MEYAVIEIGGKQYKVKNGDILELDHLKEEKDNVSFDKVLLHVEDSSVNIGKPYLQNLTVTGKILEHLRGEKIRVARFTAKSRHRRVIGFRPSLTRVQIGKISAISRSPAVKTTAKRTTASKTPKK